MVGSEEKLRELANEQREKFLGNLIERKFIDGKVARQVFRGPLGDYYYLSTTKFDNGATSTQLTIRPDFIKRFLKQHGGYTEMKDSEINY